MKYLVILCTFAVLASCTKPSKQNTWIDPNKPSNLGFMKAKQKWTIWSYVIDNKFIGDATSLPKESYFRMIGDSIYLTFEGDTTLSDQYGSKMSLKSEVGGKIVGDTILYFPIPIKTLDITKSFKVPITISGTYKISDGTVNGEPGFEMRKISQKQGELTTVFQILKR